MTQDPYHNAPPPPPEGQGYEQQSQGGPTGQPLEGQPHPSQPPYQAPRQQGISSGDRTWMILAHLSAPIAFIVSAGSLSFLGPLLIWFFRKDDSPAVRQAAAGAFNFNLSFWILYLLGWVVGIVTLTLGFIVVIPFWIVIFLVAAYAHIKGALKAAQGETYHYPFQLPILR